MSAAASGWSIAMIPTDAMAWSGAGIILLDYNGNREISGWWYSFTGRYLDKFLGVCFLTDLVLR